MEPLTRPISPYGDDANSLPRPKEPSASSVAVQTYPEQVYSNGKQFDLFLNKAVRTLRDVEYWINEWHGATLDELKLLDRGDHALCVVKARHNGKAIVAFAAGATMAHALLNFLIDLSYNKVKWKADEYRK